MRHARPTEFLAFVAVSLALAGCAEGFDSPGETPREQSERLRAVAKQNAEIRRMGRSQALRTLEELRPMVERGTSSASDCRARYSGERHAARLVLIACGNYDGSWPFFVPVGYLRCEAGTTKSLPWRVVFGNRKHGEYALNAAARVVGYRPIQEIVKDTSDWRKDRTALLGIGLDLCRHADSRKS